jgi:hypothetical protein
MFRRIENYLNGIPEIPLMKAEINLPNGTKITIEGGPEEVLKVQKAFTPSHRSPKKKAKENFDSTGPKRKPSKVGPLSRIRGLIAENFFEEKRTMSSVIDTLKERAVFYKNSDISPSLIRLVKKKS